MESEIRSFPPPTHTHTNRLKKCTSTKPEMQEMKRDCFKKMRKERERQREREREMNTGTKGNMAMNKHLSIITLNVSLGWYSLVD